MIGLIKLLAKPFCLAFVMFARNLLQNSMRQPIVMVTHFYELLFFMYVYLYFF